MRQRLGWLGPVLFGTVLVSCGGGNEEFGPGPSPVSATYYFAGDSGTTGYELWKTDGSFSGTQLVRDIMPGSAGSRLFQGNFLRTNFGLFFLADDGIHGLEPWRSDGTTSGTTLIKDINISGDSVASSLSVQDHQIIDVDGTLYFAAADASHGVELWRSDGTAAGTVMVKDINPGGSSLPADYSLAVVNNEVFFPATDGIAGVQLWKTDGTPTGTVQVTAINPLGSSSNPRDLVSVGDIVYFSADDGVRGRELWKSDGTEAGTVMVKDIALLGESSSPHDLTGVSGTLYFAADDGLAGGHSIELWKSDGTGAGTVMVKDINPDAGNADPNNLFDLNGELYFAADDGTHGQELWKSNGTLAGTVMVDDINPGGDGSSPASLTDYNGTLVFVATNVESGREPWKSDGTTTGTTLIRDISTDIALLPAPDFFEVEAGTLFFGATDGINFNGYEPWRSDGTESGTTLIRDVWPGPPNGFEPR